MKTNIHYIFLLCSVLITFNGITTCAPKDETKIKERNARIKLINKILDVKANRLALKLKYTKRIRLKNIEAGEFKEEDTLNGPLLNDSKKREEEFLDRVTLTEREKVPLHWVLTGKIKKIEAEEIAYEKKKIAKKKKDIEYNKWFENVKMTNKRQAEWIENRIKQDKERRRKEQEERRKERERDRNIKIALMYPAFIIMKLKSYSFF